MGNDNRQQAATRRIRRAKESAWFTQRLYWATWNRATYIQVLQAYGLMKVGHKIGFFGTSNVAVNTVASAFWKYLPPELKHMKFLRLETRSTQRMSILKDEDYMDWPSQDANLPRAMKPPNTSDAWKKDLEYQYFNKYMNLVTEMASGQELFDNFRAKEKAWKGAWETMQRLGNETSTTCRNDSWFPYRRCQTIRPWNR